MRNLVLLIALSSCAPEFSPAYPGEPDCGRHDVVHSIERATCDGSVVVACSCDDRNTLECIDGSWQFSHFFCAAGLGVRPE